MLLLKKKNPLPFRRVNISTLGAVGDAGEQKASPTDVRQGVNPAVPAGAV